MKEKPRQVVSGCCGQPWLGRKRPLVDPVPTKNKKSLSIQEVKEVGEVRDDRPACFVILLS